MTGEKILITGADGFIGKNLVLRIKEAGKYSMTYLRRGDDQSKLRELIAKADIIFHLAGENRPDNIELFKKNNTDLTVSICDELQRQYLQNNKRIPIFFTSSTQAVLDNAYGRSKLKAEEAIKSYINSTHGSAIVYRLPGVFGKWCKPNYNSVVATFCHNISRGLPIQIDDNNTMLKIVYIDDVIDSMTGHLDGKIDKGFTIKEVSPVHEIRLGELAETLKGFESSQKSLEISCVGNGLTRALYSTYLSYCPKSKAHYQIASHMDQRGNFVEMLKTKDSGQFSYFTVHPGVTRGGHYHHTKTEKFLVVRGSALFRFRHVLTNEKYEITTNGDEPTIVDTIPGWSHDITNVGNDEMIVMLWANEVFDANKPDTVSNEI